MHSVGNIGNTHLVIDDDFFEAKYDWLSTWDDDFGEGDELLPEDYFHRKPTLEDVIKLAQKGDEPLEFLFASGAGGWGTALHQCRGAYSSQPRYVRQNSGCSRVSGNQTRDRLKYR